MGPGPQGSLGLGTASPLWGGRGQLPSRRTPQGPSFPDRRPYSPPLWALGTCGLQAPQITLGDNRQGTSTVAWRVCAGLAGVRRPVGRALEPFATGLQQL